MKTGFYAVNPQNSLTATTNSNVLTYTAHVLDYGPTGKTFSNAGSLYANDLHRGFDVYGYTPGGGTIDTRTAMQIRYDVRREGLTTFVNGAWCANPSGNAGLMALNHH